MKQMPTEHILQDQSVIVVTGGARGIGRATVERFLVVCVIPGWIATESSLPDKEDQCWLVKNVSLERAGKPKGVAKVVWFLAGQSASYITGQAVIVDGGMTWSTKAGGHPRHPWSDHTLSEMSVAWLPFRDGNGRVLLG